MSLTRRAHALDGHGLIGFTRDHEHRTADGDVALRIAFEELMNGGDFLHLGRSRLPLGSAA